MSDTIKKEIKTNIYDFEIKNLSLNILADKPTNVVSFDETILGYLKNLWYNALKKFRMLKPKQYIVNLQLASASVEKVLRLLTESLASGLNSDIASDFIEKYFSDETLSHKAILNDYSLLAGWVIKNLIGTEKSIRIILDDIRLENGYDFIPKLTMTQRIEIINAFNEINPIFIETKKKMELMNQEAQDLEKIEKQRTQKEIQEVLKK